MQRSANRGKKHAFLIEDEDDDEYEDDFRLPQKPW